MDPREPAASSTSKRTFEVGPCLGKGGFGEVYHAIMDRPGGLRTEVALKVLHQGLHPRSQAVERLRDEGRLLGLLRHPAIVRVLDLAVLEGRVTLVSEYIEGVDLHAVRGEIGTRAAVEIIGIVADALAVAWRQEGLDGRPLGLVHRDVKPANIRLGRHGEVKLLDFGIAKARLEERDASTSTGMILGSMPYLSPERMAGKPVGPPGDIYALGATLWECLVGRRLAGQLDVPDQVRMALDAEEYAEFLEEQLDEVEAPDSVKGLLRSMLDRGPEERPTAHAVANLCDALVANLEGRTLRTWARTWAWPGISESPGPLSGRTLTDGKASAAIQSEGTRWVPQRPPEQPPSIETPEATQSSDAPVDTMDVHEADLTPEPDRRGAALYIGGGLALVLVLGLMCAGLGGAVAAQQLLFPNWAASEVADASAEGASPGVAPEPVVDEPAGVTGEVDEDAIADDVEPIAAPSDAEPPQPPATATRPGRTPVRPEPERPTTSDAPTEPASARPSAVDAPPEPAPAEPAPAPGRIEIAGRIVPEIRNGAVAVPAGEVHAGTYTLWYDFGEGLKKAGTIEVAAGQTVTVQCNSLRYDCSSR